MASTPYVTPPTIAVQGAAAAADQNKLRDGILAAFGNKAELRIARTAGQAISTTTVTSISWDTETTDTDGFFAATSTTAATIPSGFDGRYIISVNATFTGAPSTRDFLNLKVGSRIYVFPGNATEQTLSGFAAQRMTAGDTVQVSVFQQSGSTRGIQGTLEMERTAI